MEMDRRHVNWTSAEDILSNVIEGASSFELDEIPGLRPEIWQRFPINDRDPRAVEQEFVEYCLPRVAGLLVVVTFASFKDSVGPLFVRAEAFPSFVEGYWDSFGELLVDGDVVVVSAKTGKVIAVHHSELITTIEGRTIDL
ncbi:hypothetical protein E1287_21225 [Actinomadura sp. KC06]|uniref:hypothetical protein n=1 Tax=Actinomadura sp. KC06 TaxID=2530369 RepID=UPI001046E721|nr:hypothetical protein [Actinomadura sp. KC06]TDD32842.1 hypothetical protein E1287_21225 [Actinomadura sp. KC06]